MTDEDVTPVEGVRIVAPDVYLAKVVEVARSYIGVRESGGRNRGPEVDRFLRNVHLDPTQGAYSWCAAFVVTCYQEAAEALGVPCPLPTKASVHKLWDAAATSCARFTNAGLTPDKVPPGAVFSIDHGGGLGHCGIVAGPASAVSLATVEGNTNPAGSREGDGVYPRERVMAAVNLGFVVPS